MECCPECFGDRGLRRNIFPLRSAESGICSYCASENVPLIGPTWLAEYFQLLQSAYQQGDGGQPLVHWCRQDWGMFAHKNMDDPRANDLLTTILEDVEVATKTLLPAEVNQQDRLVEWQKLRDELMFQNRFFPSSNIDLDRLALLLSHLRIDADEVPALWYRARIQNGDVPFTVDQIGAPPQRSASHGRANPAGIPYLYFASDQRTAVSEIRPHTGEIACVADSTTSAELKLVDLRWPRRMVSPFLLTDALEVSRMRSDLPFLERLGDELTRPVVREAAAFDYIPSQYLCEFIKTCEYDGVVYRSSVGEGINLALFDPANCQRGRVDQYRVSQVSVVVAAMGT